MTGRTKPSIAALNFSGSSMHGSCPDSSDQASFFDGAIGMSRTTGRAFHPSWLMHVPKLALHRASSSCILAKPSDRTRMAPQGETLTNGGGKTCRSLHGSFWD